MLPLTPRQAEVLAFIQQHIAQRGYAPSFRESCAYLGVSSKNGIAGHLKALRAKGHLASEPHKARALVPIKPKGLPFCGIVK